MEVKENIWKIAFFSLITYLVGYKVGIRECKKELRGE